MTMARSARIDSRHNRNLTSIAQILLALLVTIGLGVVVDSPSAAAASYRARALLGRGEAADVSGSDDHGDAPSVPTGRHHRQNQDTCWFASPRDRPLCNWPSNGDAHSGKRSRGETDPGPLRPRRSHHGRAHRMERPCRSQPSLWIIAIMDPSARGRNIFVASVLLSCSSWTNPHRVPWSEQSGYDAVQDGYGLGTGGCAR